jgi:hypothetical protein
MYKTQKGGGCADLYCILCGGPTYSREIISNTILLKKYLKKNSNIYYNVKPSGLWEDADAILNYIKENNKQMDSNDYKILKKSIIRPKNHKWQNKLIMITEEKIIKDVESSGGEHYTEIDGEKYDFTGLGKMGHLAHRDCYKLLSTKYGKFKFNDINMSIYYNTNYGLINKYQGQFFYSSLAFFENQYLLESPLENDINKTRILKLNLPINKNSEKKSTKIRPSPSESATLFKVGTKKTFLV